MSAHRAGRAPIRALCALCALCLALFGCAPAPLSPSQPATDAPTPLPYVIQGDSMSVRRVEQVLYYPVDAQRLKPVLSTIVVMPGETLLDALVEELLTPRSDGEHISGLYLLGIEQSQGVATVKLTGLPSELTYITRCAIVNTLTEQEDVRFVNILINGKSVAAMDIQDHLIGVPAGAMERVVDVTAFANQLASDHNRIVERQSVTRAATLYFASREGDMLLPEVRDVQIEGADPISALVEALLRGPGDPSSLRRALPVDLDFLSSGLQTIGDEVYALVEFTGAGERVLRRGTVDIQVALASLVYTLTTFIPDIEGVIIQVGDEYLDLSGEAQEADGPMAMAYKAPEELGEEAPSPEIARAPHYTRSSFDVQIGRGVTLYYPLADGTLKAVVSTMTQADAGLPRNWLKTLFEEIPELDEDFLPFPGALREQEVAGIALSGETALINLSARAAAALSGATELQERAWIYAVVNTMCDIPGVRSVRFLVEGAPVDTLGGHIWQREPLLPNPGLVKR